MNYWLRVGLLGIFLYPILPLILTQLNPHWLSPYYVYAWLWLGALTILTHLLLVPKAEQDHYDYQNRFMLSNLIRLIGSASALALYYFKVQVDLKIFIFNFFILYFAFTVFEITTLLSTLRPHFRTPSEKD